MASVSPAIRCALCLAAPEPRGTHLLFESAEALCKGAHERPRPLIDAKSFVHGFLVEDEHGYLIHADTAARGIENQDFCQTSPVPSAAFLSERFRRRPDGAKARTDRCDNVASRPASPRR